MYVEMPRGFKQKRNNGYSKVLKLKKTLYGIIQSPFYFWKYMTAKLEACGLDQSIMDT